MIQPGDGWIKTGIASLRYSLGMGGLSQVLLDYDTAWGLVDYLKNCYPMIQLARGWVDYLG